MFKLTGICFPCSENDIRNNILFTRHYLDYDLSESDIYTATCAKGHENLFILDNFKYEMLFEVGLYAIKDEYFRESISSFSASLERAYEVLTKVMLIHEGIPHEKIHTFWNSISRQSERQLGAFIAIYLQVMKDIPKTLPNKKIEFRNEVIHKGRFPNRAEAIEYGQVVLEILHPLVEILNTQLADSTKKYREEIKKNLDPHKKITASMQRATVLTGKFDKDPLKKATLEEILLLLPIIG